MNKLYSFIISLILIAHAPVYAAPKLTPEDSLKIAEMWWDKGYEQYESGNYEMAYSYFSKSYSYWKRITTMGRKNPYTAMNHCLYKLGKMDQIDKKDAPYYYEELDTTNFYSAEMRKADLALYNNKKDSALIYFHQALRSDTIRHRQNRLVHATRLKVMADELFNFGHFQDAIDLYKKEEKIRKGLSHEDSTFYFDLISQKVVESYLRLGKGDSALAVALEYVNRYKDKAEHFVYNYENAERTLFNTYLILGKYDDAYKEIFFADSVFLSLDKDYYQPTFKKTLESEFYRAIGRFDKSYKIKNEIDHIQKTDTTALYYQNEVELAITSASIWNFKKAIAILEEKIHKHRYDTISPLRLNGWLGRNPLYEISLLADYYLSVGQAAKALDKYLWIDSAYNEIIRYEDSVYINHQHSPNEYYVANVYKLSRFYLSQGNDSLGNYYYDKLAHEIKLQNKLSSWERSLIMLDSYKYIRKRDFKSAILCIESYLNGSENNDINTKEWLAYLYILNGRAKEAFDIESQIIDNKRNAIVDNFEELSENERFSFWNNNATSFRNLTWSILMQQDSSLVARLYDDVALFSKGLMLTVSSNPEYKRLLDIKWKDIRANLKKGELAVEFLAIPELNYDSDSTIYIALCIKNDMEIPKAVFLGIKKELEDALVSSEFISNGDFYDYVWGDIENEFRDVSKIYFSADGFLHKVPLEYIAVGKKRIHKYRLTSTREIALKRTPLGYNNAILYGGIDKTVDSFKPLKHSQLEVDTISHFLRNNNVSCRKYCNEEGTKSSFFSSHNSNVSILHFATHGIYYKNDFPQNNLNQLMLNQETPSPQDIAMNRTGLIMYDGIMTAAEISKIHINNLQLVTLSTCESALGDIYDGEGVFGLQRAFKQVGAQSILMTLWNVDDKATAEFMAFFYKRVSKGDSLNRALLKAQNHMKSYSKDGIHFYESPTYWAGFVLLDAIDN